MAEMFNPSQALGFQNPDIVELNRQRKLADLLISQGAQTPQGQTVSGGVYVPPNPMEYLGNLFNVYAGTKANEALDKKEVDLAKKLREMGVTETQDILGAAQGTPEKVTELAGPAYKGVAPTAVMPAQEGNTQAALAKALMAQSPQGQALVAPLMQNALPKKTNELINYEAAKQGGFKGSFDEWRNQLTPYQKEDLRLQNARLGLEAANQNKPQIIETNNGYVAVNPRTGQAMPITQNGQPVLGNKGALQGEGAKQVTGAENLKSAIANYQDKLKNFSTLDMANPNARAAMGQAYNTMMLQAKEAFNLGVLNGKDWEILQSVVTDPTSASALLLSKDTLNNQSKELEKTANKAIQNVYQVHQKQMPNQPAATPQIDPALLQYMTPEQRKLFGG